VNTVHKITTQENILYTSNDSIYRKYLYIVFGIINRIVSYPWKNVEFFDILRYFTPEVYIFITSLPK